LTKRREPLSIDEAMARIAGKVPGGWIALAKHVGKHERTVRKWGDADTDDEITLSAAIALDTLYQKSGGAGRPLLTAHEDLVDAARAVAFADQFEVVRRLSEFVKESSDAKQALLRIALPDSCISDRHLAQRELMEVREVIDGMLLCLTAEPSTHSRDPP